MLTLSAWRDAWIEYRLNPATGGHSTRQVRDPKANEKLPIDGFGSVEPIWGIWRRFYALYAYDGRLYFQSGRKKWDVTDGLRRCTFWAAGYGLCSGLIMHFDNGESHRPVLVHPFRGLFARIDPTYDGMDAESDQFFLFVRQQLPNADWCRRRVAPKTEQ